MRFPEIITWAFGAVYLALGVLFCFRLQRLGSRLGTTFGREGLIDSLAVYGGLHLAIGAFMIVCAINGRYGISLLLGLVVSVGLGCIRTVSMFAYRTTTRTQLILLAPELVGVVLAAIALALLSPVSGATG